MFTLPPLPYAEDGLAPVISANTLTFHHGKHHKTYVDNLNNLIKGSDLEGKSLEEIVQATAGKPDKASIFNNAAQVWNHAFYWMSMRPKGGGAPTGRIADLINQSYGNYDTFKKELSQACVTQFGSGWGWVVLEGNSVKIQKTGNADTPIARGGKPLLTIDVWEHAYYLDYQNKRPDHVNAVIDKLLNWGFANENL